VVLAAGFDAEVGMDAGVFVRGMRAGLGFEFVEFVGSEGIGAKETAEEIQGEG
jgi:hypothetical protein